MISRYTIPIVALIVIGFLAYIYYLTAEFLIVTVAACSFAAIITFNKPSNGLLLIVPFMVLSPEIVGGYIGNRPVTIRIEDFIIISVFVSFLARASIEKEWKGFVKTPVDNILIALAALMLFSTSLGIIFGNVNPVKSMFYVFKYFEYFMIFWMVANIVDDESSVKLYISIGVVACIVVTIYAYSLFSSVQRVYAPFDTGGGEPASLGGYYLIIYALLFSFILHCSKISTKILIFLLICFIMLPFVRTLSRASYLAMLPLIFTVLFFTTKGRIRFLILMTGIIMLFPVFFPAYYSALKERIIFTFSGVVPPGFYSYGIGNLVITDLSPLSRIASWGEVLKSLLAGNIFQIVFGKGVTGFWFVEGQFFLNLAELGIAGVVVFYYLLLKIFLLGYRVYNSISNTISKSLSLGLMASLTALLFQSLSTNTFAIVRIMEPFCFLAGLVAVMPQIYKQAEALKAVKNGNI